jgi:putative MFS transporter
MSSFEADALRGLTHMTNAHDALGATATTGSRFSCLAHGNTAGDDRPSLATIAARLERLPATATMWRLVGLVALGWLFETYDIYQVAYVSPALIASGLFRKSAGGLLHLSDQANFAAVTAAGVFVSTIVLGWIPDRYGRRATFGYSMIWYSIATACLALQTTAVGIMVWRFVATLGIGVQLMAINAYVSELVPRTVRGKAFALVHCVGHLGIPVLALFAWILTPRNVFGIPGWRFVVLFGGIGGLLVWTLRARIPESPRWLAQQGRIEEAHRALASIEEKVSQDIAAALPPLVRSVHAPAGRGHISEIFSLPYRRRTTMLVLIGILLPVGLYGFANWLPALMGAKVGPRSDNLRDAFLIALAYPIGPLLFFRLADRFERKWQVAGAALTSAVLGLMFAVRPAGTVLVLLGLMLVCANTLVAYGYHAYLSELFPTRIRAQAGGFIYSWSRAATMASSYLIAYCLDRFGSGAVFSLICASMIAVVILIGLMGPRTRGLMLEEITP